MSQRLMVTLPEKFPLYTEEGKSIFWQFCREKKIAGWLYTHVIGHKAFFKRIEELDCAK
jgi:hypothetical protein